MFFFFFKQKTAYEIYQCDWSSDVCSSDLISAAFGGLGAKTRNGFGCFKILSDDLGVVEQLD